MSNNNRVLVGIYKSINALIAFSVSFFLSEKEISKIMKISEIRNRKLFLENVWVKKWRRLSIYVNRKYYRTYSRYIGENENIVPDDICHNIIETILNPIRYRSYYEDKNMFDKVLNTGFKKIVTPATFVRNINGAYYDSDYKRIRRTDIDISSLCKAPKLVAKSSVDSCSGKNIVFFQKRGLDFFIIGDFDNKLTINLLEDLFSRNFVLQECLQQSDYMSQFCKSSVNTIRVQLYRSVINGEIIIPNMILRMGKNGSLMDNAHLGGCFIGIDVNTGELNNHVCNQYGKSSDIFNGIDFKSNSFVLPNFHELKDFAIKVGECIPHHHLIALDVMLDKNNQPILIEYNISGFSLWLFQFTTGTAFGSYTDEIIEYCERFRNDASRIYIAF